MQVEIGALVEKKYGQIVKDKILQFKGVEYVFFATGRSDDLFEQKQFGSFGEAAIITIVADEAKKESIFRELFSLCELHSRSSGLIFMSNPIERSTIWIIFLIVRKISQVSDHLFYKKSMSFLADDLIFKVGIIDQFLC